jgi:hypothetical protein
MNITPAAERILGVALAIAAVTLWSSWRAAQRNSDALKAVLAARAQEIVAEAKQIQALNGEIADANSAAAEVKEETRTPADIVKKLPLYLPLPKPIELSYVCDDVASGSCEPPHSAEPEAPIVIPPKDLPPLFQFSVDCHTCEVAMAKQKQAIMLLGQEVDALKAERNAAVKASKGGGFWSKLKENAHWFAIGGAAAAGAMCISGHCK